MYFLYTVYIDLYFKYIHKRELSALMWDIHTFNAVTITYSLSLYLSLRLPLRIWLYCTYCVISCCTQSSCTNPPLNCIYCMLKGHINPDNLLLVKKHTHMHINDILRALRSGEKDSGTAASREDYCGVSWGRTCCCRLVPRTCRPPT